MGMNDPNMEYDPVALEGLTRGTERAAAAWLFELGRTSFYLSFGESSAEERRFMCPLILACPTQAQNKCRMAASNR